MVLTLHSQDQSLYSRYNMNFQQKKTLILNTTQTFSLKKISLSMWMLTPSKLKGLHQTMPPELSWSRNLQIELLVTKLKYKMQAKMLLRTSQWIPWCHLYSCITLFNSLNPLHSELISSKWALVLITCTYSNQSNKNYSNKLKVVCTKSKTLLVILLFCNLCLMIMLLTLSQVSLFQSIKCSVVENF